jgi:hypothetical protein
MKLFCIAALLAATAWPQEQITTVPRIGAIEIYGLHRVSETLVRQALGVSEGAPLPPSKAEAEDRILDINRVVSTELHAECCEDGKSTLYVGIEEFGAAHYEIRPAPGGSALLPEELWIAAPTAAAIDRQLVKLREVVRDSSEPLHREAAITHLQRASRPATVIEDLRFALTDNESAVRAQAIRSLITLAQDPKNAVSFEWFVPLLNSISWSDRTLVTAALESATRNGANKAALAKLRGAVLDALIETSRWRSEQYAYPAFQLLGRVAGLTDATTRDAWLRSGRDSVIAKAKAVK